MKISRFIQEIKVTVRGGPYASAPAVTIGSPATGGTQATATAILGNDGGIDRIVMTDHGTQYQELNPTVTIDPPSSGVTAEATAITVGWNDTFDENTVWNSVPFLKMFWSAVRERLAPLAGLGLITSYAGWYNGNILDLFMNESNAPADGRWITRALGNNYEFINSTSTYTNNFDFLIWAIQHIIVTWGGPQGYETYPDIQKIVFGYYQTGDPSAMVDTYLRQTVDLEGLATVDLSSNYWPNCFHYLKQAPYFLSATLTDPKVSNISRNYFQTSTNAVNAYKYPRIFTDAGIDPRGFTRKFPREIGDGVAGGGYGGNGSSGTTSPWPTRYDENGQVTQTQYTMNYTDAAGAALTMAVWCNADDVTTGSKARFCVCKATNRSSAEGFYGTDFLSRYDAKVFIYDGSAWNLSADPNDQPDVVTSHGGILPGDYIGAWIFNELRDALNLLTKHIAFPNVSNLTRYESSSTNGSNWQDVYNRLAAAEWQTVTSEGIATSVSAVIRYSYDQSSMFLTRIVGSVALSKNAYTSIPFPKGKATFYVYANMTPTNGYDAQQFMANGDPVTQNTLVKWCEVQVNAGDAVITSEPWGVANPPKPAYGPPWSVWDKIPLEHGYRAPIYVVLDWSEGFEYTAATV